MIQTLSADDPRYAAIRSNIKAVREKITEAALRSGRRPEDITLVAVTKTMPAQDINAALACGIEVFGENRVQELLSKLDAVDIRGKKVHLIGHLQTNKVRRIIDKVDMIQSLDSLHLAAEIDRQAAATGKRMDVLVEINIGGEASKSGIAPQALETFLEAMSAYRHIRVCGLMAIPPLCEDKERARHYFAQMHDLFIDIAGKKSDNMDMRILSMGMSSDYETAIEEGSTMVRIGTAIFGKRNNQEVAK